MYQKQLEEYFAAHRDEMIEDICTLIRIPSDRQEARDGMPFGELARPKLWRRRWKLAAVWG